MPELPEVETTKRFLSRKIVGKTIKEIKVLSPKQLIGEVKLAKNRKISGIERRAKILVIRLENGAPRTDPEGIPSGHRGTSHCSGGVNIPQQKTNSSTGLQPVACLPSISAGKPAGRSSWYRDKIFLLIHLKLTGQLVYSESSGEKKVVFGHPIPLSGGNTLPGRSTRIIIYFDKGVLFFNDLRKFGWIKIAQNSKVKDQNLEKLGVEPLSKDFTPKILSEILSRSRRPVKLVLMDQEKIAGIGNIYANDALWEAKINPEKPANQVKRVKVLRQAIIRVLKDGIKYGGSSTADEAYIKPDGTPGKYQYQARVYQRDGQPCHHCGTLIQRTKISNRGTFFCPKCQK
ncbi:MAG: bifunctional DNA-formamidopyrimidine glycosylase/DNA-(apurinic or apyrimidinic site) lyase [Patescibacteria group bacterium]|nr:bifunctional DNA-formamidopyrimidine glycosylase/DNA-(apurinic or apyrimidinic site) lyase [Patescibacteria group bacterium]